MIEILSENGHIEKWSPIFDSPYSFVLFKMNFSLLEIILSVGHFLSS